MQSKIVEVEQDLHLSPYSALEADAYRQGYEEATLVQTAHNALASARVHPSRSVMLNRMLDFAASYPLITTASIGAAGATTMFVSAKGTYWLLRRFFSARAPTAYTSSPGVITVSADRRANPARSDPNVEQIVNNVLDKVRLLNGQLIENIDRRWTTLTAEINSKLDEPQYWREQLRHLAQEQVDGGKNQVGKGLRKDCQTPKAKALGSKDEIDSRLRDLEGQIIMANKDRRVELNGFRNELMGQLKVLEDMVTKVGVTSKASSGHLQEAISGMTERIQESFAQRVHSGQDVSRAASTKYHVPPLVPSMKSHDQVDASRQALYDNIAATREKYQAIMKTLPSVQSDQEGIIAAPDKTEDNASKEMKGWNRRTRKIKLQDNLQNVKSAVEESSAESLPVHDTVEHIGASREGQKDVNPDKASAILNSQHFEPHTANGDSAKQVPVSPSELRGTLNKSAQKTAQAANLPLHPGPRLGIDDSGNWRFVLPSGAVSSRAVSKKDQMSAGWRTADVIFETSSSYNDAGPFYAFASTSTGAEIYANINLFLYPEFDIVRLDGQHWRCERTRTGEYIIREKLSDVTLPEWDGVGFEKD